MREVKLKGKKRGAGKNRYCHERRRKKQATTVYGCMVPPTEGRYRIALNQERGSKKKNKKT
jgi:hypothetical protein